MKEQTFIWIIISLVSFFIELMTPTFFFLSIAFAGIFAWLVSFITNSLIIEIIVFLIFFVVFFYFLRPLLYKNKKEKFNSELLIGKTYYVNENIDDKNGIIIINGSKWQARSVDGKLILKDKKVSIVKIDGNKLIVTEVTE